MGNLRVLGGLSANATPAIPSFVAQVPIEKPGYLVTVSKLWNGA